ncbi:MAG: glycosyltransferase [Ignavibacteriae bacterium]|nr:glycosyltransferase [Ignavibacteriota bacterium]MCB9207947.1 glycosyltransferase [Ignavibacteriales bacterium]MCB9258716.1 glycosyltransferase [Ignavibacteriales bacterium]
MIDREEILMLLDNAFNPDLRVQKEINSLINLGYKVDLFCWDQEGKLDKFEFLEKLNITRIRVLSEKQKGLKKIFDLIKFMKLALKQISQNKTKYSFIYAHDLLMLPLGLKFKKKYNAPLIYDAHEIYHLMEWEKYPPILRKTIFFIEKFLIRRIDELIVVNKKRQQFYSKYYTKKEIQIIGNWYDPYIGEKISLRERYNIPENDILISYFGVINFDERPINKIIEKLSIKKNIHFFIAGVGKHEDKITEIAKVNNRVYYLGWQKNIRQYLSDIDLIIYYLNDKRKYFEYTAPNTLYLALSHVIPLITNVPGESEELISNNNIGYFVKDVEEIDKIINFDKKDKSYLAKKESIKQINNLFEWAENENKYKRIFSTLKQR